MELFATVKNTDFLHNRGYDEVDLVDGFYILKKFLTSYKKKLYSPMDFYHSYVPVDTVNQIIGKPALLKLHLLFSALNTDDDNQVCNWLKHFGLTSRDMFSKEHPVKSDDKNVSINRIHSDFIKWDITYFQFVVHLYKTMQNEETNKLIELLQNDLNKPFRDPSGKLLINYPTNRYGYVGEYPSSIENEQYVGNEKMKELIAENPYPIATDLLSSLISSHLSERELGVYITPDFDKEKTYSYTVPLLSWNYPDLLTALYMMLALDISQNTNLVRCENPLCGIFFNALRNTAKYCSDTCKNRAKQQRHRAKLKQQKAGE